MDSPHANIASRAVATASSRVGRSRPAPRPPATRSASSQERATRAVQIDIFQKLINGLPEQIALLDARWNVLAVNTAWEEAAEANGFDELRPGSNYRRVLERVLRRQKAASWDAPGAVAGAVGAVVAAIQEIDDGKRTSFRHVYKGEGERAGREFYVRIALMELGRNMFATVTRDDVTEVAELRRLREDFSTALIKTQEDERRRMAREIHDSTMQLLVGLGLAVGQLKRNGLQGDGPRLVTDIEGILYEAQRELRTISYLAHPPQLDRLGMADALDLLVAGFGRRAGLKTSFEIIGCLHELKIHAEMALYRVVQEALANIHRHARATAFSVRVVARRRVLHVLVVDNGRGIASDIQPGVGLQGMRSRLGELGGRLTIRNLAPGVAIVASVPV